MSMKPILTRQEAFSRVRRCSPHIAEICQRKFLVSWPKLNPLVSRITGKWECHWHQHHWHSYYGSI